MEEKALITYSVGQLVCWVSTQISPDPNDAIAVRLCHHVEVIAGHIKGQNIERRLQRTKKWKVFTLRES